MFDKLGREIQVGDKVVAATGHGRRLITGEVTDVCDFAIRVLIDLPVGAATNKALRVIINTSEWAVCER